MDQTLSVQILVEEIKVEARTIEQTTSALVTLMMKSEAGPGSHVPMVEMGWNLPIKSATTGARGEQLLRKETQSTDPPSEIMQSEAKGESRTLSPLSHSSSLPSLFMFNF